MSEPTDDTTEPGKREPGKREPGKREPGKREPAKREFGGRAPGDAEKSEAYQAGMLVRRDVLGDAHVDAATAAITPETADFQSFITRYAWGDIWTRPGLDRRTRSFLTIASLVTGSHLHELAMHVRAALGNGLTRAEISEAILHTAIYAGVPAANSAITVARDTFAAIDAEAGTAAGSEPGPTTGPTSGSTSGPTTGAEPNAVPSAPASTNP